MENIQKLMQTLFGSSCYCYCLSFIADSDHSLKNLTRNVLEGWMNGYIEDDGFVARPVEYLNSLQTLVKYRDIQKVAISRLTDLPPGNYAVEYKNPNGGSHFCVCNNRGVVFDPSGDSNSVKNGKILSYRRLI